MLLSAGLIPSLSKCRGVLAVVTALCGLGAANPAWAAIFENPITGTNPNTSNPYTTGQTVDPNITASGIGRGSGIAGNAANDRYNANSWNTVSIDLTAYFTFTLTPNSGYQIDFTSLVYTAQASGTGPSSFAFRSSVDSFAANIGTPNSTGTTIDLSGGAYQDVSSAIEFRLYGWGASAASGTFSVNSFTFDGTVSAVPEPTTWALIIFGSVGGVVGMGKLVRRRWRPAAAL